jgi:ABC-type Fe3+ transport system substrate-binding protein
MSEQATAPRRMKRNVGTIRHVWHSGRTGLLLLVLIYAGALNSVASAESMNELYQRAKHEQALTVYTGAGPAAAAAMAAAFQKRYPGIRVTAVGGFSNVLDADIDRQLQARNVTADLVHLQSIGDFYRWDRAGALMHFKPEGFEQVFPSMKAGDGAWVAVNAIPLFYGYNAEKVQEQDVPKSALDLLKPTFRGRVVSVYPAADDATLFRFYLTVQRYGWGYMTRYMANRPYFVVGHRNVAARIKSAEDWVSFDISGGQDATLRTALPRSEKTPVFFVAAAILKDAPHPNAAKLFLTWMLSREEQERDPRRFSPRADVPPPQRMPPLTSPVFDTGYGEFLADGAHISALRRRFELFTGPVVSDASRSERSR